MNLNVTPKILILESNIDQPWPMGRDFRRYLQSGEIHVRRAPQSDLTHDLENLSQDFSHLIITGSKTSCLDQSPWVRNLEKLIQTFAENDNPILGVCFGHQIIARTFGGLNTVGSAIEPEFGWVELVNMENSRIFEGISKKFHSFQSHVEEVKTLPQDFIITAFNEQCKIQGFQHKSKKVYGVQFHPERNAAEGENAVKHAIQQNEVSENKRKIFNPKQHKELHDEAIANTLFGNFIKL